MANRERLVIIGGVAGGMSAAAKVRRLNSDMEVTVFERGSYVSYAACGLPWFICGLIADHNSLIARSPEQFIKTGIDLRIRHDVLGIDVQKQQVKVRDLDRKTEFDHPYDTLLIATGGQAIRPRLPGIDLPGIFQLRSIEDGLALRHWVQTERPKKAVVVGGGYIGLELVECFKALDMDTTVVDIAPRVLTTTFDEDMTVLVQEELKRNGVLLSVSDGVKAFEGNGRVQAVVTEHNRFPSDVVVLGLGVRANSVLAREGGITVGQSGAIAVDDHTRTNIPHIYAAGDCAEVHHLITGKPAYIPLGTTANKQGRTAGANIGGADVAFGGVVGTAVSKVCDLQVARTGLTEEQARGMGYEVSATTVKSQSTPYYYPGSTPVHVKLIYEANTMRLLGGQIVGVKGAAKRIDVLATALHQEMTIDDIRALDLSYAPPFAPVWDPILVAANVAAKE
jgi:NADPH-dependent 2,4-dienoyl-CoA reductase/sulfur reductase-like enzyme